MVFTVIVEAVRGAAAFGQLEPITRPVTGRGKRAASGRLREEREGDVCESENPPRK